MRVYAFKLIKWVHQMLDRCFKVFNIFQVYRLYLLLIFKQFHEYLIQYF